jgi:hypothetical protein
MFDAFADALISCLDWVTATQTLTLYTDLIFQNVARTLPVGKSLAQMVSLGARALTGRLAPPPEANGIPKENNRWLW